MAMTTTKAPIPAGRNAMGAALAVLNRLASVPALDRFGLRQPVQRTVYQATKTGFRTVGAVSRTFAQVKPQPAAVRLPTAGRRELFDLTPTDEQAMISQASAEFAAEQLRPVAAAADSACEAPPELVTRTAAELGMSFLGVPESLGGAGSERSVTTGVLVAEALAHGDLGLAVALLAPSAVSTALVLWGNETQQAKYLPAFLEDAPPAAALAIMEPRALFDPFDLQTTAKAVPGGYQLDGVKSLVPLAAGAELFVIAAQLPGTGPVLFTVESDTAGLTVEAEPSMGLRAAALGRVLLDGVFVPESAVLTADYAECVRLSRLAWCALAVGTCQAVLDYVIPYVNDRVAFGEPISNRQSVAFLVADIGIELEGMRLATYRAAGRAEQGRSFARETALARRLAGEHGMQIGSTGVQLLGGHGFVKEHPVERWYRDLRAVAFMEGAVLI